MQTTKTSVHGAINMLGLAKRVKAKILQASTSEVYGDPNVHPQTEDYWGHVNPIGPRSCYDEGKRCAETLFFDYWRQHKLRIKVARIFNTYGPRMHPHDGRVVSNFIIQALLGRDITIYGDGSQTRSFCYVDDLIDGLIRLMQSADEVVGPINIGNPVEFSMLQLAENVLDLTGSKSRIAHRPLPQDDPKQRQPDISKAQSLLGWKPATPLKEGLKKTIAYFEALLREPGTMERDQQWRWDAGRGVGHSARAQNTDPAATSAQAAESRSPSHRRSAQTTISATSQSAATDSATRGAKFITLESGHSLIR